MASLARGNPARWWKSRSCGGASCAPLSLFISPFRRWFSSVALVFLIIFIGGVWYLTNPARISRLSEVLLSRALGGNVSVQSGHLSWSGTLLLSGVEVRTADPEPSPTAGLPIFSAEQIEARFDWFSLFTGQLSATQLVATKPVFRAVEDPVTGHWNYERLRAPSRTPRDRQAGGNQGLSLPVVLLRDAHVIWGEVRDGKVKSTGETIVDGELTPDAALSAAYHFQLGRNDAGAVFRGTWDTAANTFTAVTENVTMSDDLRRSLPAQVREWCQEHHLAGRLSQLKLTFSPQNGLSLSVAFDDVSMSFLIEPEQGIAMTDDRPAYPLDVSNVTGQVVFDVTNPAIHISNLTGEVVGYQFKLDYCDVHGSTFDAPFDMRLHFPHAYLGDQYPPLFMAFLSSQDLIQRVAPHGFMDIDVDLKRPAPRAALEVNGSVACHDASMRFAHFPFPMDHMNGLITFDQQSVTFHDVTAKGDESDVRITGSAGTTWSSRFIDFTVSSDNSTFDDRMAACLPEKFQPIWNLFAIRAHGSFVCRVTRPNPEPGKLLNYIADSRFDEPKVVVDIDVDDGKGFVRAMPYVFSKAAGHLHLEADETRIEHLTAHAGLDGAGRITIDGVVHHPGGDIAHLSPDLHVNADIRVGPEFMHALPDEISGKLAGVSAGGRLVFDGNLRRPAAVDDKEQALQVAGNLTWSDGTLQARLGDEPISFSGISARATVGPAGVDLQNFTGNLALPYAQQAGAIRLALSGKLDPSMNGAMKISASATEIPLPEKLPAFFASDWNAQWQSYSPAGKIDFAADALVHLHPAATDLAGKISLDSWSATIAADDVSLKHEGWPDPVESIKGSLSLLPAKISMAGMSATIGNIALTWKGDFHPDTGAVSLSGKALSKGLPLKWIDHIPTAIAQYLDTKHDSSTLTLSLDSFTRESATAPWAFDGRLDTLNLAATGPLPMKAEHASLVGHGTYDPATATRGDGLDFNGEFTATNFSVNDHILDSLTSSLEISSAKHQASLTNIDGKVAGGALQGTILIHTPSESRSLAGATTSPGTMPAEGGYQADLVLNDAQLARLLLPPTATDEDRKKIGTGRVNASLSLQETFGKQADRTGRGDITVRDGNIYNIPLSMGLMQIATLRLPVANSFQQATMSYYLRNDEITFERILLESQGINLAGLGTVRIKDRNLNLSFVTESPHELFIPILSPIIRETRNELLQLSVTGTIDNPRITPVPLSAISNTLRAILPVASASK